MANADDAHHVEATKQLTNLVSQRCPLLTTNHVIGETYTLLRVRLGFGTARAFLERSRHSSVTERVFVPESWEEAAKDLLIRYQDQDFSYVDATSFVAMQRLGLREAFAFDHHFATVGFIVLAD